MISSMLQYIQKSPDCFHAVENLRQRLMGEGYTQLTAGEWSLTPGGKYFITKNGSSLLAFRVPQGAPTGFVLTASHSDSPCFRLRDHAGRRRPHHRGYVAGEASVAVRQSAWQRL